MLQTDNRALKLLYFVLGAAVPLAAFVLWSRNGGSDDKKERIDQAHDITVEDSFPASDPPSAW